MNENPIVRVRDVMKTAFITIDGIATVAEAVSMMKENKTSVLVVNKRHPDDEYGLILAGEIARHVLSKDRPAGRVNVYEIMHKPVISVHPDMDIRHCSRLFAQYNLMRAPVIEHRDIIGMVSPISLVLDGLSQFK
ncbi:MAG: CBS domain-containing protein [Gammaproteobacteria bacterium]